MPDLHPDYLKARAAWATMTPGTHVHLRDDDGVDHPITWGTVVEPDATTRDEVGDDFDVCRLVAWPGLRRWEYVEDLRPRHAVPVRPDRPEEA